MLTNPPGDFAVVTGCVSMRMVNFTSCLCGTHLPTQAERRANVSLMQLFGMFGHSLRDVSLFLEFNHSPFLYT